MKNKFNDSIQTLINQIKMENKNIEIRLKNIKEDTAKYFKSNAGKILLIEKVGKGFRINGEEFKPAINDKRTNASITLKKKFNLEEWRKENNL